ncbi:hypothetical protein HMPREF1074_00862 [Bacteroides xylanisolvens CL03T12C04]|uniref:Phosphodiester glycosidase domain-containing protein n=2 Tax=Bacteroides xylanisolvens TaxID=371601 RepID=I9UYE9_9BACE|nr:phosphodiester glycosidase family protein [Bacteroides xylanisolvens]EIY87886.1 hypothetical protein HMPREF1074_00862 [Bacteroides xylanisolvens CL03T12C04]MBT0702163.1 Phosphodiester glycosidase [Bacteroides xylanisolvens CL03T12C04]
MKSIFSMIKNIYISLLLIVTAIFIGCSDDDGEKIPYKGATTQLMQGIADNVSYIQQIQKEEIIKISDGVSVTDVSFVYCTKPTRMLIAEIDLNKNVTIVTSTPDNKDEVGKVTQTVRQQAMKAEESGKDVLLAINGHSAGICYKDGKELKGTFGRDSEQVFYMLDDGSLHITTVPEFNLVKESVVNAVSGNYPLIIDGEVCQFTVNANTMGFRPRTFVGVSKDHKKAYFFVVDGEQEKYSNGMRLEDIMLVCQGAGCYQAINLEGDASSTMVRKVGENDFQLMNQPSEGKEKDVANGLQVIVKQ